MGLHLGIGLGLSFSYILFQTVASTFAVNGNMPPMIAMWIPNLLYALIAFYLYRKAPNNGLHLNSKGLKVKISACSCEIHKCGRNFFVVFISSFVSFPGSKSCWEPPLSSYALKSTFDFVCISRKFCSRDVFGYNHTISIQ